MFVALFPTNIAVPKILRAVCGWSKLHRRSKVPSTKPRLCGTTRPVGLGGCWPRAGRGRERPLARGGRGGTLAVRASRARRGLRARHQLRAPGRSVCPGAGRFSPSTQTVSFVPQDANVAVTLSLSYELKRRSPWMSLVDLLFIRRAMTRSLEETLSRFGAELGTARRADVG